MNMTEEDKKLLFNDLCGRLPFRVLCKVYNEKLGFFGKYAFKMDGITVEDDGVDVWLEKGNFNIESVKPCLRSLSSMTEEEVKEFAALESIDVLGGDIKITCVELSVDAIDWLNKKGFDYRELIPKGLAVEATEGMYE